MKKTFIYILLLALAMSCGKDEPTPPPPPQPDENVLVANSSEEIADLIKQAVEKKKETGKTYTVKTAPGVNYIAGGDDWEKLKKATDDAIKNGVILRFSKVDGNWEEMPVGWFGATNGSNTVQDGSNTYSASSSYMSTTILQDPINMTDIVMAENMAGQNGDDMKLVAPWINANTHQGTKIFGDQVADGIDIFRIVAAPVIKVRINVTNSNMEVVAIAEVLDNMSSYFETVTIDQSENKWRLDGITPEHIYNSTTPGDQRYAATAKYNFTHREVDMGPSLNADQNIPMELCWRPDGKLESGYRDVIFRYDLSYKAYERPGIVRTPEMMNPNATGYIYLELTDDDPDGSILIDGKKYGLVSVIHQLDVMRKMPPASPNFKYKIIGGNALILVPTQLPEDHCGPVAAGKKWGATLHDLYNIDSTGLTFGYHPALFSGVAREEVVKTMKISLPNSAGASL